MVSPGPSPAPAGRGALRALRQIGSSVDIAPGLRELIGIALLAAFGLGLAVARGDLIFVAVFFGFAFAIAIAAIRRLQ
jgi:hypothetical protein